ncbi:MAG TPA: hypothetical protein VHF67_08315, partial [Gaiellaceae bacterium]|nr:hypothetical protein [Gaiellaceae bacterium]
MPPEEVSRLLACPYGVAAGASTNGTASSTRSSARLQSRGAMQGSECGKDASRLRRLLEDALHLVAI